MRRLLTALAAALPLSLACVAAGTTSADAAAAPSCTAYQGDPGNRTNTVKLAKSATFGGTRDFTVELRYGFVDGTSTQVAWSRMYVTNAGDTVYLDISHDGGHTWKKCGARTSNGNYFYWSNAYSTSTSTAVKFRACGGVKRSYGYDVGCTGWW